MATSTLPALLLLGSYHMGNFNRDLFNLQTDDSRLLRRQKEIEECANLLQAFQPTKVAIEVQIERDKEINEAYQQYRNGSHALADDERQQLGFRIAAALGHEHIYLIDWNEPIGMGLGWVARYAQECEPEVYKAIQEISEQNHANLQAMYEHASIRNMLLWFNQPEQLQASHRVYMHFIRLGEEKYYPGIEWVQGWYGRNMRIFVNLTRITKPGDRILVIYGQGHIPLLTQFVRDSGFYTLETVESYLGETIHSS